eukprot:m.91619 g.91619  ORF g.91619 m.91619 type:complete len:260 (+) comp12953_c0_seq3:1676-2455(+)
MAAPPSSIHHLLFVVADHASMTEVQERVKREIVECVRSYTQAGGTPLLVTVLLSYTHPDSFGLTQVVHTVVEDMDQFRDEMVRATLEWNLSGGLDGCTDIAEMLQLVNGFLEARDRLIDKDKQEKITPTLTEKLRAANYESFVKGGATLSKAQVSMRHSSMETCLVLFSSAPPHGVKHHRVTLLDVHPFASSVALQAFAQNLAMMQVRFVYTRIAHGCTHQHEAGQAIALLQGVYNKFGVSELFSSPHIGTVSFNFVPR